MWIDRQVQTQQHGLAKTQIGTPITSNQSISHQQWLQQLTQIETKVTYMLGKNAVNMQECDARRGLVVCGSRHAFI